MSKSFLSFGLVPCFSQVSILDPLLLATVILIDIQVVRLASPVPQVLAGNKVCLSGYLHVVRWYFKSE